MKQDNEHIPEGYRDSPLGVIPEGWEVERLGEICPVFKSGYSITSQKIFEQEEYPVYGGNGLRGYTNTYTHNGKYILIGRQGALCGNINFVDGEIYISEHAIAVQPNEKNNIKFLMYKLDFWKLNRYSESSAQPGLSVEKLIKYRIALPPLPEQKKIAEILSTWDDAIERLSKLVDALTLRKRGLMQQLLTGKNRLHGFSYKWESIKVRDLVSKLSNGLTYDTTLLEGKPVTRIETISDGEINFDRIGFAQNCSNIESYKLEQGDILYSHINSLSQIGKIAYYNNNKPLYHGMNLLLIRTNDKNISKYLYYYLSSKQAKNIAQTIAKPAVNQASISTADLLNIKIKYPKPEEQTAIAERLTAADIEIELAKRKLSHLRKQKRGLMQQLLTGKKRLKI